MKIPSQRTSSNSRLTATQSNLPQAAGIGGSAKLSGQPGLLGNPLEALSALEQWRVHEEDTQRRSCRWSSHTMPLRVFIEPSAGKVQPVQALFSSLKQWEAASQGMVRFALSDTANQSNIIITWSEETTLGRDFEVGHTQRTVQGRQITHAHITLIQNPIIDSHLSAIRQTQRLHATVLHEVGHALGLEHSQDKRDAMYYRGWQRASLSAGDAQRILQLYCQDHAFHG